MMYMCHICVCILCYHSIKKFGLELLWWKRQRRENVFIVKMFSLHASKDKCKPLITTVNESTTLSTTHQKLVMLLLYKNNSILLPSSLWKRCLCDIKMFANRNRFLFLFHFC